MNKMTFATILIGISLFGVLVYYAVDGNPIATFTVGLFLSLFLVSVGLTFGLLFNRIHTQNFQMNAKENQGIVNQVQRGMNMQNSELLKENKELRKMLGSGQSQIGADHYLTWDEGIFEEMENEEES